LAKISDDKINRYALSRNTNDEAIEILKANPEKIM
jgi:hypothetical protein